MAVRNILFNELGFSREGVRDLVRQEVTGITSARFRDLAEVESFIIRAISKVVYGRYSARKVEDMIEAQIKISVAAHIKREVDAILSDKLKIEIRA